MTGRASTGIHLSRTDHRRCTLSPLSLSRTGRVRGTGRRDRRICFYRALVRELDRISRYLSAARSSSANSSRVKSNARGVKADKRRVRSQNRQTSPDKNGPTNYARISGIRIRGQTKLPTMSGFFFYSARVSDVSDSRMRASCSENN